MAITITYFWDFGDGYTSYEQIPVHKYARAGTYTVSLTVTTEMGSLTVSNDLVVIAPTDIEISEFSLRMAVEKAHGIGWSECEGNGWVTPKADYGVLGIIDDNDVFRMLIEDENDDWVWEEATFDAVAFQNPSYVDKYYTDSIRTDDWRWILSASGTSEYYLDKPDGGNPYLDQPKKLEFDGTEATAGTLGSLSAGEWAYGDNDALGYNTIYVRLVDSTDPDGKLTDFIMGFWWTEIATETWYKENAADPANRHEVQESHINTRPQEPENKGDNNYDSNGYRSAQEFDLEVYADGNLNTPFATVDNIPENGDIVFSGEKVEARRLQFVFKSATSEFQIVSRNHNVVVKPKQGTRTERSSGSSNSETVIALPQLYISRNAFLPLLERISGEEIDGDVTQTAGPDGYSNSAITLNQNLSLLNDAIAGTYTFMFWRAVAAPVATVPLLPALTQQGATSNGWQLMYVVGTVCPANLVITVGDVFDIRLYSSDISAYLGAYYTDVINNEEPKIYLPGM